MSVRSAQSITVVFTTRNALSGVGVNADSTPTGTLYVNGTADAASVTVTNITTGLYKAAVTLPTLAVGDVVSLRINATVGSVSDNAIIWGDTKDVVIDAAGLVDANTVKLGPTGSGTAQTARDIGASVLVGDKTGFSLSQAFPSNFASLAIDTSGRVNAFLIGILTSVFTEGATGRIAAAFKQFFNIASPAATMDHGILVDTATSVTNDVGITQTGADKVWGTAARTLTSFGTLAADVWASATRVLTAGTNIVLAKGTGITGFNDIAATAVVSGGAITTSGGKVSEVALVDSVTALASLERTAIANEVEAQIIDETDSEKVLTAITDKIASVNPDLSGLTLAAIAAAVRDVLNTSPAANSLGAMVKAAADRMPGSGTLATTADVPSATTIANQVTTDHGVGSYVRNTEPDNAGIAAIQAQTDNLPLDPASTSDVSGAAGALAGVLGTPSSGTIASHLEAVEAQSDVAAVLAAAEPIPANVKQVNDTDLTGNGSSGSPWGPA